MIGIVGGMGSYAGTDLLNKVFDNTLVSNDQDHLDTVLLSMPSGIEDRTDFLIGKVKTNPAFAIVEILLKLQNVGAKVAGISCNTAHSKEIFNTVLFELNKKKSSIEVLNMIEETISFISKNYPTINKVGVLSTTGTYKFGIYKEPLIAKGFDVIVPPIEMQEKLIHPAIYNPVYGIKPNSNPIHSQARENLLHGVSFLKDKGAQAIILGCTEIPLAITEKKLNGVVNIDPANILARALINIINPDKLKSFKN